MAQVVAEVVEEEERLPVQRQQNLIPLGPFCKIDASWKDGEDRYGGGCVIENEDGNTIFGSFASNRVLSPLHAEFGTPLWAMKSSLALGYVSMAFGSDCLQLVKLIEEEEEWTSLMVEFDEFIDFRSKFTL